MDKITDFGKNVSDIIITTMCALINSKNEVLMINRCKSWKGWALPGGHIEPNESILDCVIREIKEETGFTIIEPIYKGIAHFYNENTGDRQIIFNFVSYSFEGLPIDRCDEGILRWIPKQQLFSLELAEGMEHRFDLFFKEGITEMYVVWTKETGYISKVLTPYSSK